MSPDGSRVLSPSCTCKKERKTIAASGQSQCVAVCSGEFPVQSDWVQFPGVAIQFVVRPRAILAPESFFSCCQLISTEWVETEFEDKEEEKEEGCQGLLTG